MKLPTLNCKRCEHIWIPRIIETKVCPKCHSPYWNIERSNTKKGLNNKQVTQGY